jgi:hypothetical protein
MSELTQVIADSIVLLFQIFETLFSELDSIILFDISLFTWVIVLTISVWLVRTILNLLGLDIDSLVGSSDLFND